MFGVATQNGVGVGIGSIPSLSAMPYSTLLYQAVLGLFSSGAQGAFLDANDWANVCFQDAAGTTPVTAMEQPIGLIRDKSGRGNNATSSGANRPVISARYNLLLATAVLSTQSVTVGAGSYTLYFTGSGSVALSGAATGTKTAGSNVITCTAGTLTLTVTGSVLTADLRPSDQATGLIPTYQRVDTSSVYDTVGFPVLINGNGSNQYLTGNMDLSSTNKVTVWAGVRKFSDAAGGMIFELTASANANPGSLYLAAPVTAAANVQYASKGTVLADVLTTGVAAPKTMVLTGRSDISAPLVSLGINGVAATSSATQGTGNFSNAAYYVLSRAGASLFSSGGFNSLIVLGAAATAAQISTTEAWANSKLRAY